MVCWGEAQYLRRGWGSTRPPGKGIQAEGRSWSADRGVVLTLAFLTLKSPIGQWGPTHHSGAVGMQKFLLGPTS